MTLAFRAEHPSHALCRCEHRRVRHPHIVGGLADGAAIDGDPPEGLPGPRFNTLFHGVLDLLCLPQQERTSRFELLVFLAASRIDGQQKLERIGWLIGEKTDELRSPLTKQVNGPGMAELPEPAAKRPARIVLVRPHSIRQLDPDFLAEVFECAAIQAISAAPANESGDHRC